MKINDWILKNVTRNPTNDSFFIGKPGSGLSRFPAANKYEKIHTRSPAKRDEIYEELRLQHGILAKNFGEWTATRLGAPSIRERQLAKLPESVFSQNYQDQGPTCIYVGNLQPDISVEAIQKLFEEFGRIRSITLKNRRVPSFSFVDFENTE